MSSLDPPTYLASLQSNIRQRPIPWDGAVRAGSLTDDQLAKIRAVDKAKKDARQQTVEADLDGYRTLFTSVLESAAKRQDVVQYVLVLLNDLLNCTLVPSSRTHRRLHDSRSFPPSFPPSFAMSLSVHSPFSIRERGEASSTTAFQTSNGNTIDQIYLAQPSVLSLLVHLCPPCPIRTMTL